MADQLSYWLRKEKLWKDFGLRSKVKSGGLLVLAQLRKAQTAHFGARILVHFELVLGVTVESTSKRLEKRLQEDFFFLRPECPQHRSRPSKCGVRAI